MKLSQGLSNRLIIFAAVLWIQSTGWSLFAQTLPGRAEVRSIKGSALYSVNGGPAMPLKVGTVLTAGSTIKTAAGSTVDLFLGNSSGVVRVTEDTTLGLDKLTITETGADTVVENQLNLPEGTMLFNVNKLSAASKYEIRVPNGVAGIRGTKGRISANAYIVLVDGSLVFVHVPTGGNPTPHTMTAPPPVYFSPIEGVKLAPDALINEVRGQFSGTGGGVTELILPPSTQPNVFVAPDTGHTPTSPTTLPPAQNNGAGGAPKP